ncbi:hypothetical protein FSP39_019023 [Pinctada imbricata]|uniref:BHLH domain-containing protein n=1 Tax=Pinctada imbricata TaxID=66713 RepID=A0AA88YGP2_PINIB|nr:hypothetical protein FSP39_019023 [Pinctada imbricata]
METSDEENEKMKKIEMTGKESKGTDKGTVTKKRINKPMIERRRRERINECLQQLYSLITELDKEKPKKNKSKLEKADILEMAVDFIKRNRYTPDKQTEQKQSKKESEQQLYVAGYNKCCKELTEMIDENQNIPCEMKQKLTSHLQNCQEKSKNGQSSDEGRDLLQKEVFKQFQTIKPKTVPENTTNEQNMVSEKEKSRNEVSTASQTSNGANFLVCNTALPTYILVPAASVCKPLHVIQQQQTTPVTVVNQQQTTNKTNIGQSSINMLDLNALNLQQPQFVQVEKNPSQFIPNFLPNLSTTQPLFVPYSTNCHVPSVLSSTSAQRSVVPSNPTASLSNCQPFFSIQLPTPQTGSENSSIQQSLPRPSSQSSGTMWRPW